jgi:hypothetical protein
MNVAAKPLDAAVAERLVTAVTPVTIELTLETLTSALRRSRRRRPKLGHRGFADRELQARRDRSVQLLCDVVFRLVNLWRLDELLPRIGLPHGITCSMADVHGLALVGDKGFDAGWLRERPCAITLPPRWTVDPGVVVRNYIYEHVDFQPR